MPRSKSRRSAGAPALERTVADLRALAHPLRLRMMELFAESPKTTKQVAELLGEPPTRLYHHVAALERAGLLVLKETRQNRGAVEKWYAAIAQQLQSASRAGGSAMGRKARRAVAATALEQAKQEIMAIPPNAAQAALLTRLIVVAPAAKIPEIRRWLFESIQQLSERFALSGDLTPDAIAGCERWALTLAFAPVTGPRRSGRRPRSH
jgi:predicted transcriptional regulator